MRERHVAHAEGGKFTQHGEIAADHVAAFDAHQRGDLAFLFGFANLRGGGGQHDIIRMFLYLVANSIDLFESTVAPLPDR